MMKKGIPRCSATMAGFANFLRELRQFGPQQKLQLMLEQAEGELPCVNGMGRS